MRTETVTIYLMLLGIIAIVGVLLLVGTYFFWQTEQTSTDDARTSNASQLGSDLRRSGNRKSMRAPKYEQQKADLTVPS